MGKEIRHFDMVTNSYYNYLKGNKDEYCSKKRKFMKKSKMFIIAIIGLLVTVE